MGDGFACACVCVCACACVCVTGTQTGCFIHVRQMLRKSAASLAWRDCNFTPQAFNIHELHICSFNQL